MRKKILLLVLGLISGCTQPSVTVVAPQSTAPIVKPSTVVTLEKEKVMTPSVKPVIVADNFIKSNGSNSSFNSVKEVKEGTRNAYITLVFKDENKIRWGFENYKFTSLKSMNTDNINKIIGDYKIKVEYIESTFGKSESELEEEQKINQQAHGSDYPNKASIYYLSAENTNVKELTDKLRKESIVLSANESSL